MAIDLLLTGTFVMGLVLIGLGLTVREFRKFE
jgi:hypothetical protein